MLCIFLIICGSLTWEYTWCLTLSTSLEIIWIWAWILSRISDGRFYLDIYWHTASCINYFSVCCCGWNMCWFITWITTWIIDSIIARICTWQISFHAARRNCFIFKQRFNWNYFRGTCCIFVWSFTWLTGWSFDCHSGRIFGWVATVNYIWITNWSGSWKYMWVPDCISISWSCDKKFYCLPTYNIAWNTSRHASWIDVYIKY